MTSNVSAIILLLLSIATFIWGIGPQKDQWTSLRATAAARDEALKQAKQVRTMRDGLLVRKNSIGQDNLDKLSKLLPDSVDTIRLTMDLKGIAARYSIPIKKITINKESGSSRTSTSAGPGGAPSGTLGASISASSQKFDTLGISFGLTCSYQSFLSFLNDLEKSLRIIDITSVTVAPGKDVGTTGTYEFTINARTYSLKQS